MSRPALAPAPWRLLVLMAAGLLALARPGLAQAPAGVAPPRERVLAPQWERSAEQLAVEDRGPWRQRGLGSSTDEAFALGGHAITAVHRSAISTQRLAIGPFERRRDQWTLSYRFQGATAWEGRCDWRSEMPVTHRLGLLPEAVTTLRCTCDNGQRAAAFSISDEWRPAGGELLIDGRPLQIQQLEVAGQELGLSSRAPAFLLHNDEDQLVAVVDTLRPGRAWRQRGLAAHENEPLSCLAAAILLSYPD